MGEPAQKQKLTENPKTKLTYAGDDYTLPIGEFERVERALHRMVGDEDDSVQIIDTYKNGRVRVRIRGSDTLPAAIEIDDTLRDELNIKGLRRVSYHAWQK